MPNNKKGQGKKGRKKSGSKAARDNGQQPTLLQRIQSTLPSFQGMKVAADHDSTAKSGGYYDMYKAATLKFHNWMAKEACPDFKMSAVNDYRNGVQYILDHNMKVYLTKEETQLKELIAAPREIMASLALSIRLREKVTTRSFVSKAGGDLGHQYIIDVLKYCQTALRFTNRMAAAFHDAKEADEKVQTTVGGRFSALALDDDEDDEMDWEDVDRDIKDGNLPKYTGVEVQEEIDIKEALLKGDDRFQAIAFLHTMNDLMGDIRKQYEHLKNYMRGDRSLHRSPGCMPLLMECAVVANVATDNVNRAENELTLEHPHLSSVYHVLALVIWPELLANINQLIDTMKLKKNPHMALQFVAEVVECSFQENSGFDRIPLIVKRFVKKSCLGPELVESAAVFVHELTNFEILVEPAERPSSYQGGGTEPHMWLSPFEHIGGDYCILSTHQLTQTCTSMLADKNTSVQLRENGELSFDENNHPARRIWGDLDEPFATSILQELIKTCKLFPFDELPGRPYLTTVLNLLRRHVKGDSTKPVPIALSFGLHAILMSIFVLQGDGDVARVAGCTKQSYNRLFEQWQTVADRSKSPENSPSFYADIRRFGCFEELAKPIYKTTDSAEMLAFWNPLIGGEFMLFATYICSIGTGCTAVDLLGQLRSALHLYNGLSLRDPTVDIPFLEDLDTVFNGVKAVWAGGKPEKGSCCQMFWMSMGVNARPASRIAFNHAANQDTLSVGRRIRPNDMRSKKIDRMRPEDFSVPYERLVKCDFRSKGIEDCYVEASNSDEGSKSYEIIDDDETRLKITLSAMYDDKDVVLPMNFVVVGSILLEFMFALSDHMGWSSMIQDGARKHEVVERRTTTGFSSEHKALIEIWGDLLSFVDRDLDEQVIPEFDIDKVSAFTKSFFDNVEKKRYVFFVEKEEEEKEEEESNIASNR